MTAEASAIYAYGPQTVALLHNASLNLSDPKALRRSTSPNLVKMCAGFCAVCHHTVQHSVCYYLMQSQLDSQQYFILAYTKRVDGAILRQPEDTRPFCKT